VSKSWQRDGLRISANRDFVFPGVSRVGESQRTPLRRCMGFAFVLIVAVLVFGYLLYALLRPERF
jgi:K+-transporting ATPase KdpF subunit